MSVLSTSYFPNIQYVSKFLQSEYITIDVYEHYQRRTFRNRCTILSANGLINLSVPLIKKDFKAVKDVQIDYSTNWQKQHYKSIESAYNSSPFYEYIIDDFRFVFESYEKYLIDMNNKILDAIRTYIPQMADYSESTSFVPYQDGDWRLAILPKPKQEDKHFLPLAYYQTFGNKFPFQNNLSILDLLFNEGNLAYHFLKQSIL